MKEKHCLRWTAYRGLKKVLMQAMFVCAAHEFEKTSHIVMESDLRLFIFLFTGLFFIKIGFRR
jgi:hypothetical protein